MNGITFLFRISMNEIIFTDSPWYAIGRCMMLEYSLIQAGIAYFVYKILQ